MQNINLYIYIYSKTLQFEGKYKQLFKEMPTLSSCFMNSIIDDPPAKKLSQWAMSVTLIPFSIVVNSEKSAKL